MSTEIKSFDNPGAVKAASFDFLIQAPVINNVILTILTNRIAHDEPGLYWLAVEADQVVGVALQSPLTYPFALSEMRPDVAAALAETMARQEVKAPGVSGVASVAAHFAGQWAEVRKAPVIPFEGQRLYQASRSPENTASTGRMRRAGMSDLTRVHTWLDAFQAEAGTLPQDNAAFAQRRIEAGEIWLWEDDGVAVSMAANTQALAGVVRLQAVFTPEDRRRRGYCQALVGTLTQTLLAAGHRPILYTDLGNPTSNSVYRRVGYEAVAELIRYEFRMPMAQR